MSEVNTHMQTTVINLSDWLVLIPHTDKLMIGLWIMPNTGLTLPDPTTTKNYTWYRKYQRAQHTVKQDIFLMREKKRTVR